MARRVLVIDDDPQARQLVAALLEPEGFAVRGAAAGAAGITLAEAEAPDLILLDVQMPDTDGYEVCRRPRQNPRTRPIPVVMLTARDDPGLNRKAYAGAHARPGAPLESRDFSAGEGPGILPLTGGR